MYTNYINVSGLDNATTVYYYEKLREKMYSMVYYLNKSIDALSGVDGALVNYYNIDDNMVNNVAVGSVCEILKSRVSYLNNTIIPSINSKINSLK